MLSAPLMITASGAFFAQGKGSLEELVGSYTGFLWSLDRDVAR